MNLSYYNSPVGLLEIAETDGYITGLSIVLPAEKKEEKTSPVLLEAQKQLDEYFSGKRFEFDLPLKQTGTAFQQKAWEYLLTIPYGQTVSYKNEAEAIGSADACRAAGSANGKNNIAIIVPCHRVVNTGNKLGGYAYGLDVKQRLLDMEKKFAGAK
ncbi:methylated-DNA--[protein]-cysteine S-methyltransferase [Viscerimonas tarda]